MAEVCLLPEKYSIVGYARLDYNDHDFREQMRDAIETLTKHHLDDATWSTFAKNLFYQKKMIILKLQENGW